MRIDAKFHYFKKNLEKRQKILSKFSANSPQLPRSPQNLEKTRRFLRSARVPLSSADTVVLQLFFAAPSLPCGLFDALHSATLIGRLPHQPGAREKPVKTRQSDGIRAVKVGNRITKQEVSRDILGI